MSSPTVSVVIPAYNRAGSIRASAESVLRQSYRDFELIVVDDGSQDDTFSALDAVRDSRLRCIAHPRNRGVSAARNTGIAEARGVWVAFQDSDDEWMPDKLEKQMARIASVGARCVGSYCGMTIVGSAEGGSANERYYPTAAFEPRDGDILESLLKTSLISTQTLVARRDLLTQIGGFDEGLPALVDWDCVLQLARLGPFVFVDEPLVRQYFSDNSITRSREKRAFARERIVAKNLELLERYPSILAGHYRSIAGEKRRLGDLAGALVTLRKARQVRPFDLRLWAISGYLTGQELLKRMGVVA